VQGLEDVLISRLSSELSGFESQLPQTEHQQMAMQKL